MNLKFITFDHLKILANNLKNYLNKYNEIIKKQRFNAIAGVTAITTLANYNIAIPTVEMLDYSDVEIREYPEIDNVETREYPEIDNVETRTYPDIKTIDETTIPDIKTIDETTIPNIKTIDETTIPDVYVVPDIDINYTVHEKIGICLAISYWVSGLLEDKNFNIKYYKYQIVNGRIVSTTSDIIRGERCKADKPKEVKALGAKILNDGGYNDRYCLVLDVGGDRDIGMESI